MKRTFPLARFDLHRPGFYALLLLAASLPFEWPGVTLGPLRLTNLELLLALVLGLSLASIWQERGWRGRASCPAGWLWLWAALAGLMILSALLAPALNGNALKASVRAITGLLLALAIPQLVRRPRDLTWLALALCGGGLLAAAIGWLEIASNTLFPWLDNLREIPTTAGPFRRLSGSFAHANQAAMYIEATLPLLLALLWQAARQRRWFPAGLATVAGLLYLQGSLLTYSRASFVAIGLSSLLVVLLNRRRLGLIWLGLAGSLLLLVGLNVALNPIFRLRLSSEGDNEWYRLTLTAPETLTIPAGEVLTTTVTVRNDGFLTWRSSGPNPIYLGAHWYPASANKKLGAEPRWPLPQVVRPGDSVVLSVPVQAPLQPGNYQLEWDMVQEQIVWFSEKNGQHWTSQVTILPGNAQTLAGLAQDEALQAWQQVVERPSPLPPIPGRGVLWRIAARQLLARPLLGIGLDNFRLTYGTYLDQSVWNESVHTNNWYLEMLVSLGVLGSLPFFAWLLLLGWDMWRKLPRPGTTVWRMAVAAGLLAYLLHGLLDYFLLFYNTGLLFWLLVGLWISPVVDSPLENVAPPPAEAML